MQVYGRVFVFDQVSNTPEDENQIFPVAAFSGKLLLHCTKGNYKNQS
jgi:hypothetical protein